MARYILLVNWTDQGIRNVKESPKQIKRVAPFVLLERRSEYSRLPRAPIELKA